MPESYRPARTKSLHVFSTQAQLLAVPVGWELLPPGDAALNRRLNHDGPTWTVKEKKALAAKFVACRPKNQIDSFRATEQALESMSSHARCKQRLAKRTID